MKIALIADIHSNLFYLKKILKLIDKEKVDQIYCLGDLVGYYDSPNEVIEICMSYDIKAIKGNHEKYILNRIRYNPDNEKLYLIKRQRNDLDKKNLEYLNSLPDYRAVRINGKSLYLTHSKPGNCADYIYRVEDINKKFILKYDYYCFGHTHIPLIQFYYGTCVLNPGAVGQPRDYTKKPSFIIIDFDNDSIILNKVDINYGRYIAILKRKGIDIKMLKILNRDKDDA